MASSRKVDKSKQHYTTVVVVVVVAVVVDTINGSDFDMQCDSIRTKTTGRFESHSRGEAHKRSR